MSEPTTILVAGGTGFLGINTIQRLLASGYRVRATLHTRQAVISDPRISYVQADLTRMEDCQRVVQGAQAVFMCAANTSGAAVINETPLAHVTPNVVMNAQMLAAAYAAKVEKFVFIGSSAAYPATGSRPVREEEMFLGEPEGVYYSAGWMKRYSEILCRIYAEKVSPRMTTIVIRPSNIYGPFDKFDPKRSHVTAALIRKVVERQRPIEVWGTGADVRDLIYIDDFLDGMMLAFEKSHGHLAVNLASGQGYTVTQILQTLLEVDGYEGAEIRYDSSKPRTTPMRLIDASLAKRLLGFQPAVSLDRKSVV